MKGGGRAFTVLLRRTSSFIRYDCNFSRMSHLDFSIFGHNLSPPLPHYPRQLDSSKYLVSTLATILDYAAEDRIRDGGDDIGRKFLRNKLCLCFPTSKD